MSDLFKCPSCGLYVNEDDLDPSGICLACAKLPEDSVIPYFKGEILDGEDCMDVYKRSWEPFRPA